MSTVLGALEERPENGVLVQSLVQQVQQTCSRCKSFSVLGRWSNVAVTLHSKNV
jgi:hypothetical protein